MDITIKALFDLSHTEAASFLERFTYPWEALAQLGDFIKEIGETLGEEYEKAGDFILIHKTAKIHKSADITGPCIIGADTELRPGAFLRGNVMIGKGCVIGNSCEVKNSLVFDSVQLPHFNYAGDSIFGYHSHMGAGAITSNVKGDKTNVVIHGGEESFETNRKKVGAFLGDHAEIGCNSVLNPGSVIGRESRVYPLSNVRGVIPQRSIYKSDGTVIPIQ